MGITGIETNNSMIRLYKNKWNYNGRKKKNYMKNNRLKMQISSKGYKKKKN